MMKDRFDFDNVGKRMPYTVPDGFFKEMEDNVLNSVACRRTEEKRVFRLSRRVKAGMAATAVASVVLAFVLSTGGHEPRHTDFAEVEKAFCNLSPEDQMYMLSVYQEDVFMEE